MKKARKLLSIAFAFITVIATSLFTACAKDSTIYLTVKSDDHKPAWFVYVIIAVAVIAVILILLKLLTGKKKVEEEPEDAVVLTQDPNAVSEYISEEERRAAKEAAEEKTEEVAEEITEEAVEEAVEEATEEKTEDAIEELVEEVADTSFISETEEKAEVTTEEIPEEITEEPEYTIGANGLPVVPEGKVIRYKWSFLARLIQSDDELKYRYMLLRRKLLSYKKVRSNVSWNFDSYFIGRRPIVKLKVRGKTLVAYFPIDPQEMQGTKYVGEDFSGVSRYKAVPFAYRINGMRKFKYAVELIEKQLEGIKSTEPVYIEQSEANEVIPRESFKRLFEKGYVRVGGILAVGERASSQDDDDDDDIIDVIENETDEEAALSELREEFNFNPKLQ